jgi:hypothetical protein
VIIPGAQLTIAALLVAAHVQVIYLAVYLDRLAHLA